ncbi:hypothetical protein [Acinetobacter johnsonii]|jgi:hypothetical protein|uniref:hypothetical protein n=1 Tax=Acinetobacter johnsonii TaxID=40214 RepID=UPI000B7C1940|nr:hypothetical protein [Acinetobacter johnsonii]MCV2451347.1 hypothetical protein [Acinetobacter johnsonii]MWC18754.1 hypothetical protein [Acinetobacter johnsonii]QBK71024.1 hypothetical protein E0Z08_16610 [Acinetobacter johnsonii]SNU15127.1 Uncharacterised protein [Acinetobacter johnsonii]
MRLKYITLCLLGLSISGCTQHVIKSNASSDQQLGQQATQGLNAMFENASYDFKGQFSIQSDFNFNESKPNSKSNAQSNGTNLDPELKKQLDQLLKNQKISFTTKEKQALYDALAREQNPYASLYGSGESRSAKVQIAESLVNLLNDLQFSYQGSVHFRQKLAALTLQLSYQKPTLQVQAQLPMVVDFNDYKFYTNYFAFMPFMVNRESQDRFAYIDFSKHKDAFGHIDFKKFAEYLKQMNALPYALAEPNQVHSVDLSKSEKEAGLSKKIRYMGDLETAQVQLGLFEYVNKLHYTQQIQAFDAERLIEASEESSSAANEAMQAEQEAEGTATSTSEDLAHESLERVTQLINQKAHSLNLYVYEDVPEAEADAHTHGEADDEYDEEVDEYAEAETEETETEESDAVTSNTLSEEACDALINNKNIPIGKVTVCRDYQEIDVLAPKAANEVVEEETFGQTATNVLEALKPLFTAYQTEQLVDAQRFKQLWQKHQAEITPIMAQLGSERSPFVMDVGLDQKGRAQNMDYNIVISDEQIGKLQIKSTNQVFNYGSASAIDRQALRNAKSIEEVSKGSLLENVVKGMLGPLGADSSSVESASSGSTALSQDISEYYQQVAQKSYARYPSEVKAYQTVFALVFAAQRPEYIRYYSSATINEISEVYAYEFLDIEEPKGAGLKRLQKLRQKHALEQVQDFDALGKSVANIVDDALEDAKENQHWKNLVKKYKTKQAVFAQVYQDEFKDMYSVDSEQTVKLAQAAQIFAKAFADDLKGQQSEKSLQGMTLEHIDFFSDSTYYETYKAVQKHMN